VVLLRKLTQGVVLAAVSLGVAFAGVSSAVATPSKTITCDNCHGGSGAYAIAVFNGSTKVALINSSSGSFSATVGKTYTVFAVKGPTTSSGLGTKSVTPTPPPDTTAPVTASDAQVSYAATATVLLSATDAGGSGVATTYYIVDGGSQVAGTSVVVGTPGTHTVEYWSVDNSGNAESPHGSATFTVGLALPTSATFKANTTVVSYGGTATFTGVLSSTSALSGKTVVLQYSTNNTTWRDTSVSTVTDALGAYTLKSTAASKRYFRVRFSGDTDFASTTSAAAMVTPRVYLTRSTAPTKIGKGKAFTSYGYLKPRHTSGTYPVKIRAYRYQSGKWVLRKTVSAKASNYSTYTKYTARFTLPYTGKWRLRSYHAADSKYAATYSTYRYVTVK
jgi:hypothetical protein